METKLDYDNGPQTYEYTGVRLRYGMESNEGGNPVYLSLGISINESEYTDVASGRSKEDLITALELGIGFDFSISSSLTIYGETNAATLVMSTSAPFSPKISTTLRS